VQPRQAGVSPHLNFSIVEEHVPAPTLMQRTNRANPRQLCRVAR
jgi:hypothetical protein